MGLQTQMGLPITPKSRIPLVVVPTDGRSETSQDVAAASKAAVHSDRALACAVMIWTEKTLDLASKQVVYWAAEKRWSRPLTFLQFVPLTGRRYGMKWKTAALRSQRKWPERHTSIYRRTLSPSCSNQWLAMNRKASL